MAWPHIAETLMGGAGLLATLVCLVAELALRFEEDLVEGMALSNIEIGLLFPI